MLKYFRNVDGNRQEISYDEALNILLGTWKDNDMTRDMLTIPNRIQCMFSYVDVEDHKGGNEIMVLMAGCYNILPPDVTYDDNGMHVN